MACVCLEKASYSNNTAVLWCPLLLPRHLFAVPSCTSFYLLWIWGKKTDVCRTCVYWTTIKQLPIYYTSSLHLLKQLMHSFYIVTDVYFGCTDILRRVLVELTVIRFCTSFAVVWGLEYTVRNNVMLKCLILNFKYLTWRRNVKNVCSHLG